MILRIEREDTAKSSAKREGWQRGRRPRRREPPQAASIGNMMKIELREFAAALSRRHAQPDLKGMAAAGLADPVPAFRTVDEANERLLRNIPIPGRKALTSHDAM